MSISESKQKRLTQQDKNQRNQHLSDVKQRDAVDMTDALKAMIF